LAVGIYLFSLPFLRKCEKTRVMAFRGMEPIRSKICINNKTLKQQNTFNYLGYNIFYEGEKDLNMKAANFVKVLGIINQIFKPLLVSRHKNSHL
jgi:hypothetical protein